MSLSQCRRVEARDSYLHLHGLVFETSIYSWQDQPGKLASFSGFFAPFSRRFARRRDLTPRTLPPPRAGRSPSVPRLRARSFFRCSDDWRRAACELLFEPACISIFSRRSSGRSMRHPCLGFRNLIGHPPLTYVSFPAGVRPAARCNILVWGFAIRSAIRRSHWSLFRPAFVRLLALFVTHYPSRELFAIRSAVRRTAIRLTRSSRFEPAFVRPLALFVTHYPSRELFAIWSAVRRTAIRLTRSSRFGPAFVRPLARSVRYTLSFSRAFRNPIRRASHGHPPHTVVSFWAGVCLVARSFASSFVRSNAVRLLLPVFASLLDALSGWKPSVFSILARSQRTFSREPHVAVECRPALVTLKNRSAIAVGLPYAHGQLSPEPGAHAVPFAALPICRCLHLPSEGSHSLLCGAHQVASPRSGAGRSANPPVARHTTGRQSVRAILEPIRWCSYDLLSYCTAVLRVANPFRDAHQTYRIATLGRRTVGQSAGSTTYDGSPPRLRDRRSNGSPLRSDDLSLDCDARKLASRRASPKPPVDCRIYRCRTVHQVVRPTQLKDVPEMPVGWSDRRMHFWFGPAAIPLSHLHVNFLGAPLYIEGWGQEVTMSKIGQIDIFAPMTLKSGLLCPHKFSRPCAYWKWVKVNARNV